MNRRHALLLVPGAALAGALGAFVWPRPSFGFGPVHIGMPQDAALEALGPGALRTALCRGVDGALFDWRDDALRTDVPLPAMAMFGLPGGAVSEIETSVSYPDGGWTEKDWRDLVAVQRAELSRRVGMDATDVTDRADDVVAEHSGLWRLAAGDLSLEARWMRRSGAVFSRMHWIAAGQSSVIV